MEGEKDDHSTRSERRTAQRMLRPARDPGRGWADQTTDQGNHRAVLRDGTGSASGLPEAWTSRDKQRKCAQWDQPKEAQRNTRRDRQASFEPQLVQKHQTRVDGFEDKILTLYARGMTTRDIQAQVQDLSGVEVSPTLISNITEAVMDEVRHWQNRPLDSVYPMVSVDCLVVKVRENQRVINKAIYLALGVDMEGQKELLGMWIAQTEGAKFWLAVFTELQNRGVKDIFIACMDGLTGLPEAIETLSPQTRIQLCMVHLVRNSLK